jgi:hypothetical protein
VTDQAVTELTPHLGVRGACETVGAAQASYYRRHRQSPVPQRPMDRLGQGELREVETRLGRGMVTEFGLDLTGLALDMTNFATFIDTGNERAPIAQRGKAKQKRTDLRLVGLALVITRDGGLPVIAHA